MFSRELYKPLETGTTAGIVSAVPIRVGRLPLPILPGEQVARTIKYTLHTKLESADPNVVIWFPSLALSLL